MKSLFVVVCATVLLAGCGGGSSGSSGIGTGTGAGIGTGAGSGAGSGVGSSVQEDAPRDGVIVGRVQEAGQSAPLEGVEITLSGSSGEIVASTRSDVLGDYRFAGLGRGDNYAIDYVIGGYLAERFSRVVLNGVGGAATLSVEPVRLVSNDNAGSGGLSGVITDALSGESLAGVTVEFRRGINARSGALVKTVTTAVDGSYSVAGLAYGNYTCIIFGAGLQTSYSTVFVLGGIDRPDQNGTISPAVGEGNTRIVLTWGSSPQDLDSHLTGPASDGGLPFHVYFVNRFVTGVNLDVDDVSGFGPETITLDSTLNGVLRYSVLNYTDNSDSELSASGARVQVIRAEGQVAEFHVPRGLGDLWTVFDLVEGQIRPVNTITSDRDGTDFFAPETRGIDETDSSTLSDTGSVTEG